MKLSVVITTYAWDRYGDFRDAIRSVEKQSYGDIELVFPLDGDGDLVEVTRAIADGGTVGYHPQERGLAAARNRGAELATGDVYVLLDDAVAVDGWAAALTDAFDDGALAAGGPAVPVFPNGRPWFLPADWGWLVGGGPYHDERREVRNTYGYNIAFRADVFDELGGFDDSLGKNGNLAQGEETDLVRRLREEFGRGVEYLPEAAVRHRVYPEQLEKGYLLRRAFAQGQSKRAIGVDDEETDFLADIIGALVRQPPWQSAVTLALTAATGVGFLSGSTKEPARVDDYSVVDLEEVEVRG